MRSLLPFILCFLWPAVAAAGAVTYEPAAGCPSREALAKRLAERAPQARDVDVKIHASSGGFAGEATVGVGDDAVARQVEGRTCDAVVDALVLAVALDKPEAVPPPKEPVVDAHAPAAPPPTDGHPRSEVAVGIDATARDLPAGLSVYGAGVFAEGTRRGAFGIGWYRPSIRAGFVALSSTEGRPTLATSPAVGFVRAPLLTFFGASVDACPLAAAPISTRKLDLVLGLCGQLDVGSAGDVVPRAWIDSGGITRAALQVGRKSDHRFFFELSAGLLMRLGASAVPAPTTTVIASPQNIVINSGNPDAPMLTLSIGGGVIFQ